MFARGLSSITGPPHNLHAQFDSLEAGDMLYPGDVSFEHALSGAREKDERTLLGFTKHGIALPSLRNQVGGLGIMARRYFHARRPANWVKSDALLNPAEAEAEAEAEEQNVLPDMRTKAEDSDVSSSHWESDVSSQTLFAPDRGGTRRRPLVHNKSRENQAQRTGFTDVVVGHRPNGLPITNDTAVDSSGSVRSLVDRNLLRRYASTGDAASLISVRRDQLQTAARQRRRPLSRGFLDGTPLSWRQRSEPVERCMHLNGSVAMRRPHTVTGISRLPDTAGLRQSVSEPGIEYSGRRLWTPQLLGTSNQGNFAGLRRLRTPAAHRARSLVGLGALPPRGQLRTSGSVGGASWAAKHGAKGKGNAKGKGTRTPWVQLGGAGASALSSAEWQRADFTARPLVKRHGSNPNVR